MSVVNLYEKIPKKFQKKPNEYKNYKALQIEVPCRIIFNGASGSMKTNSMLNVFRAMNCWSRIYLFCKNLEQPLYNWLIDEFESINKKVKREVFTASDNLEDELPPLEMFNNEEQTLMIFDDIICESQYVLKTISNYFIRGRSKGISVFFISQDYYKIPKVIRSNADYLILKRVNTIADFNRILREYTLSVKLEELKKMYNESTKNSKTDFFMIDLNTTDDKLKFRKNFEGINNSTIDTDDKKEIK